MVCEARLGLAWQARHGKQDGAMHDRAGYDLAGMDSQGPMWNAHGVIWQARYGTV
jgi:hypothetical protein